MDVDVIGSILSFVPLKNLKSVLIANSKLPDISLYQYPFGVFETELNYESELPEKVPTIYKIFDQKAFKLLKNPNISQYHLFINAIHCNSIELVKVMLKNKRMDISKSYTFDSSYSHKKTERLRPLTHALSENRTEIVRLLLKDKRVDPNAIQLHWHPSIYAINKGHVDSLKALMEDTRVNFISRGVFDEKELNLVMTMALRSRYYSVIKLLVDDDRVKINKKISGYLVKWLMAWIGCTDMLDRPDNGEENDFKIVSLLIEQPGFDFSRKDQMIEIFTKYKRVDLLKKLSLITE